MGYTTEFAGSIGINPEFSVKDYNWLYTFSLNRHEGPQYPGIWCHWISTKDGDAVEWDGREKFDSYVEWLQWLIDHFFIPHGYTLNGEVTWEGEDQGDVGKILVIDNVIRIKRAKVVWEWEEE